MMIRLSPAKPWVLALLIVGLTVAVPNCGGSKPATNSDATGGASSTGGGSGADGSGGIIDPGTGSGGTVGSCLGIGQTCESSSECCSGRRCDVGTGDQKTCLDETVCLAGGGDCNQASECCSLSCDGTCKNDGSICKPVGTDCGSNSECCSNDCQGTCQPIGEGCAPLGEVCSNEGFDAACCSKHCQNHGSDEAPDLRCARSSTCGARGEICTKGGDCCSGVCIDGRCPTQNQVNGALFAGEPCTKDSDCASYACAPTVPEGPKVCQFLGGCRPAGEICSGSWQCCSNINLLDGGPGNMCQDETIAGDGCVAHAIEGLATCALMDGPKETGEICKDTEGNDVHECCPLPNCEETVTGVWRCSGASGFDECRGDGETCQAADQCCSGVCSPVETDNGIELRCGPCVASGGMCTTNSDCCGGLCNKGVCDGASSCVPLGGDCSTAADCCSGICNSGSCGTEIIVR